MTRPQFDGQFAIIETGFILTDPRWQNCSGSAAKLYLSCWVRAVQMRRETLPIECCSREELARISGLDVRTINKSVTYLAHDCSKDAARTLLVCNPDGSITVRGVRKKHPGLSWRDPEIRQVADSQQDVFGSVLHYTTQKGERKRKGPGARGPISPPTPENGGDLSPALSEIVGPPGGKQGASEVASKPSKPPDPKHDLRDQPMTPEESRAMVDRLLGIQQGGEKNVERNLQVEDMGADPMPTLTTEPAPIPRETIGYLVTCLESWQSCGETRKRGAIQELLNAGVLPTVIERYASNDENRKLPFWNFIGKIQQECIKKPNQLPDILQEAMKSYKDRYKEKCS